MAAHGSRCGGAEIQANPSSALSICRFVCRLELTPVSGDSRFFISQLTRPSQLTPSPQPAHSQQAQPTVIFTTRFGTKNWRMRALCSNHGGGHPFPKKIVILLPTGIPAGLIWSYIFRKIEGRVPTLQPSPSAIFFFIKLFFYFRTQNMVLGSVLVVSGDMF